LYNSLFTELVNYTKYHFGDEEQIMFRTGVDARHISAHLHAHQAFLHDITLQRNSITSHRLEDSQSLLDYLVHWLAYHILGMDQNMARQVQAIQRGSTAAEAYEVEEKASADNTEPLLNALAGLVKQISRRNQQLYELTISLEQKVEERTRQLQVANDHLQELALTDTLTGLPNRRQARRQLSLYWQEAISDNIPLACMMIDADHFKEVNDQYGHDAGDFVLRELARTLRDTVRNDDIVCRLGGDEFFIICLHTTLDGSWHLAEQLRAKVSCMQVQTGPGVWKGSISIGVAERTAGMATYDELIKHSDDALYLAKQAGKNCVRKFQ
jgi:diguanylate cyclase (GGDEF)-like protein